MRPRMGVARCCCAGTGCLICADTFDRSDSTDINTGSPCGWAEDSGDGSISSNKLSFSAAGIARSTTTQVGGGTPAFFITVNAASTASGADARILFDYVDVNNYKIAEVVFGTSGSVRLRDNVAGVITTRSDASIAITSPTELQLCYTNSNTTATFRVANKTTVSYAWGATVNGVVALATSSVAGGQGTFDDFGFFKHDDLQNGCPRCFAVCAYCPSGIPLIYQVTLALVADICGNCANFNVSFNVPLDPDFVCRHFLRLVDFACGVAGFPSTLDIEVRTYRGGNPTGTVIDVIFTLHYFTFQYNITQTLFRYTDVGLGQEDCLSFSNKNIPFLQQLGGGGCDFTGATCALTSL